MTIITSDVVFWYDIQEGTGATLDNAQGNAARDGTITGADWTTGGPTNLPNGLDFVRANADFVSMNNTITELITSAANPFSFAFWLKWDGIASGTAALINDWGSSPQRTILPRIQSTDAYEVYISDTGTTSELQLDGVSASTTLLQHWVITRSGNNMALYLNGSSVDTNIGSFVLAASTTDLMFSNANDPYDGRWHQGIMLNKAIDATEAASLYNSGAGITYAQYFASGPANLKTLGGLAKASVKTVGGLAMASVKTVGGLA